MTPNVIAALVGMFIGLGIGYVYLTICLFRDTRRWNWLWLIDRD